MRKTILEFKNVKFSFNIVFLDNISRRA